MMIETMKKFKNWILSVCFFMFSIFGAFQFYDYLMADFMRIVDHANAQQATDRAIQGIQKQSTENSTDLLYIHKRGVRGELNQAKEELRMLRDFDDVDKERQDLVDEITDLEIEMERYDKQLEALKPPS